MEFKRKSNCEEEMFFQSEIKEYESLIDTLIINLTDQIILPELWQAVKQFERKRDWNYITQNSNDICQISAELLPCLAYLDQTYQILSANLPSLPVNNYNLIYKICKLILNKLDEFLFKKMLLKSRFSQTGGLMQLSHDIDRGLVDLIARRWLLTDKQLFNGHLFYPK